MPHNNPVKHIAVGGMSYCGSTLINLCLGSLPGTKTAGETTVTIPNPGETISGFSFQSAEQLQRGACVQCGAECQVFTQGFRESLQCDPSDWTAKFAEALSADTLITSEKLPQQFRKLYPKRNHHMLTLFKHPVKHWHSFERRRWRKDDLTEVSHRWASVYRKLIDYDVEGKRIFLDFSQFQRDPGAMIKKVCESFDIEFSTNFWRYWEQEHHYINGNFAIRERMQRAPERLPIKTIKSDATVSMEGIESSPELSRALKTFDELSELSI